MPTPAIPNPDRTKQTNNWKVVDATPVEINTNGTRYRDTNNRDFITIAGVAYLERFVVLK
jgi:hypothetical protein